jgi:3-hydroxybutyryl-CoA dehydrogenase
MTINKIGIVGCGLMGAGIATVCIQAHLQVIIRDLTEELIKKGIGSINSFLAKSVEKGKLSQQDKEAAMNRIKGTTNLGDLSDCDLIIEAAVENLELKKSIFVELDNICSKNVILATNTSVLPVIDIAMATSHPDRVIGTHFFNPAPLMKLLEIVQTIATSDETVKICQDFGKTLGKETVLAKDNPGFIVNRLSTPFLMDSIRMLESGAASRDDIDNAVILGLNHPIGPLRLLDMIGIDTVYAGASSIYEETKDTRYAPPVLMKKMLAAGWLGQKTGKGFYDYK